MRILTVNSRLSGGGAELICSSIARECRARGDTVYLALGQAPDARSGSLHDAPAALPSGRVDHRGQQGWWTEFAQTCGGQLDTCTDQPVCRLARRLAVTWLAQPRRTWEQRQGVEDCHFPGWSRLPEAFSPLPDLIHCHNLHPAFFDLRVLADWSQRFPVVVTLHDAWLTTGHCAHNLGCLRWSAGCGNCPDLALYPPVLRDQTASNWRRKARVFSRSRLHVVAPSIWMLSRARRSILRLGMASAHHIPNGVDLTCFCPRDPHEARAALALPKDALVLAVSATRIKTNPFKDWPTFAEAIRRVRGVLHRPLAVLCLGDHGDASDDSVYRWLGHIDEPEQVARILAAADICVHPSWADTFPNAVLEAMACGRPVIASRVGGIPQQVVPYASVRDNATGILVPTGDPASMVDAITFLALHPAVARRLGSAGRARAERLYGRDRMVNTYRCLFDRLHAGHVPFR